jgi:hypothetical protein
MATYRIEFTIQRDEKGDGDFTDVGFGSSAGWDDVDAAAYEVQSILDNRQWETSPGMPAPETLCEPS